MLASSYAVKGISYFIVYPAREAMSRREGGAMSLSAYGSGDSQMLIG